MVSTAILEVWTWLILKKKLGSKHVPQATLCLLQAHPGPTGWSVSTENDHKVALKSLSQDTPKYHSSLYHIIYYILYIIY